MVSSVSLTDPFAIFAITLGLIGGGIIKGATGAGFPVIAVPVIATFLDVRLAVIILVIPNFLINVMQIRKFRAHEQDRSFTIQFVVSGMIGAGLGTLLLFELSQEMLSLLMAAVIILYIVLRLARPSFSISTEQAKKTGWIASGFGGVLQGMAGIASPAAITFLNACKMPRPSFIFIASCFFATMCIPQFFLQIVYGIASWETILIGLAMMVPLMVAMPIGDKIGKSMSPVLFDRVILVLLAILAVKQLHSVGLFG